MRRSPLAFWGTCLLLLTCLAATASEIRYLSGTGMDDTVEWEFRCSSGNNCGEWTTIAVPSNWELQGFGRYDYGRQDKKSPETARYRHTFEVPEAWRDRRVDLVFDGVMTDAEVWLNGELAGPVHQGGFYRFRFDVTGLLEFPGPNRLEVEVREASADPSVNRAERDADYWVFGGIFRPVWLEAFPAESIRRLAIDARADGRLVAEVHLDGIEDARRLRAQVLGADGLPTGEAFTADVPSGARRARLETRLDNVRTWTAETPELYWLTVRLEEASDPIDSPGGTTSPRGSDIPAEPLHAVTERFGFRTVELRPGEGFFVNGRKVLLKGINRHSFWPASGRTTSREISRLDVALMKEMNLNAVRMSHYPPDTHFLETTDELGLYVLDELAGWKEAYDTGVGRVLVESMVTRDANHPSVIAWNNGNEGGWNEALDAVFSEYDPQGRAVLHPRSEEPFAGLNTWHYRSYGVMRGFLSEKPDSAEPPIVMPTEFLHGLYDGGGGAGLADYWALIRDSPRGGGGFLWALLDEGVVRTDREGEIDVAGNHAPDGVVGPFREREGSFFTISEIFSPVVVEEPAPGPLDEEFDGRIRLRNEHDFLDLQEIDFSWSLVDLPSPWATTTEGRTDAEGAARGPSAAPGEIGLLTLDLPLDWHRHDALVLQATAPGGRRIRSWVFPLGTVRETRRSMLGGAVHSGPARAAELDGVIRLSAAEVEVAIDKVSGEIVDVVAGGRSISLSGGPRLGDRRTRVASIESRQVSDAWEVGVRYAGALESAWWRLEPSGWLRLRYRYHLTGRQDWHGIGFDYPEERVRSLRWRGLGPYRVWRNRQQGVQHGVWETERNTTITGQTWDYPEFQGFFGGVYWARWSTDEGDFTVVFDQSDRYLHNFSPASPDEPLETRVTFPPTAISFPHLIPAIGTKFHPPEELGPAGQPRSALGAYTEDLYFYFGEPSGDSSSPDTAPSESAPSEAAPASPASAPSAGASSSGH